MRRFDDDIQREIDVYSSQKLCENSDYKEKR